MKRLILFSVMLFAGCDYPPDEAADIQKQLQAQISRGQVYMMHNADELSYVIRNSEYTGLAEADKARLVGSVEKKTLELLANNADFRQVKIYFLGDGTAGIKVPYLCSTTLKACIKN